MPLSAGDKIGHYEVLPVLGKGGEVYRWSGVSRRSMPRGIGRWRQRGNNGTRQGSRVICEEPTVSRGTAHALTGECGLSPGAHRCSSPTNAAEPRLSTGKPEST